MVKLTGFSKASPAERIEKLAQAGLLSEEGLQTVRDNDTLPFLFPMKWSKMSSAP